MHLDFHHIISKLSNYKIDTFIDRDTDIAYKEVRFIYNYNMDVDENVVYITNASIIKNRLKEYRNIGLLVIKDCDFDFSLLQVDTAIFSTETNMFELFNDVQNIFSSNRKLIDSSAALLNSLIKGKGFNYIVQVGSEILGNPVLLVDASSKLLAFSSDTNVNDTIWDEFISLGYGSYKYLSPYVKNGLVEELYKNQLPVIIDSGFENNLRRIVGKVLVNDKIVGYVAVLENNRKFKDEDVYITSLLCDVISSEMQKNKTYENISGLMYEYLIIDLLDDKVGNYKIAEERLKSLFKGTCKNFIVATVNVPEKDRNSHKVEYIRWSSERLFQTCKTVCYDGDLIIILNIKYNEEVEYTKVKLTNFLRENNLVAGLSRTFSNIMDIRKYYTQSKKALRLGELLKKNAALLEYNDLYIYELFLLKENHTKIMEFCHPAIDRIIEYDKSNGTDYYNTLYQYLINGGNITLTARKLFTHRNTIAHRMNRITEITGMDLNDGNNRFKLFLTYKIRDLPMCFD